MIAGRNVEEWREFAKRDDCLDQMVPSDLRLLLAVSDGYREALKTLGVDPDKVAAAALRR